MFGYTLTRGERNLVALGDADSVVAMRRTFHAAMREEASAVVEEVLERRVLAYMCDIDTEADMALMAFVLEPAPRLGSEEPSARLPRPELSSQS